METETRNATLQDLAAMLQEQHTRKVDMVVPASKMRCREGMIHVSGAEVALSEEGVTQTDGVYRPTLVFDEGVSEKLGIPLPYVRKMRAERVDLYDANVNGWLHGRRPLMETPKRDSEGVYRWADGSETQRGEQRVKREGSEGDRRSFLFRAFKGDDGQPGIARALLSDRYKVVDNLDVLMATLEGVREAGVNARVDSCDLTDRRMYVRIVAPEVQAYARELVKDYRSPFTGKRGDENPVVFAGFEFSNSETGNGAFSIVPRMVLEVCNNGMKRTVDAMRSVHLGAKMDEGLINWSDDTRQAQVALVTKQTRDAVTTFLDVEYMKTVIAEVEAKSGTKIDGDVAKQVQTIGKALSFSKETIDGVLGHFIDGGDRTAGGLMNAVTSWSQTIPDADEAAEVEAAGMRALDLAVAAAR